MRSLFWSDKSNILHFVIVLSLKCYNGIGEAKKAVVECSEVKDLLNNNTEQEYNESRYCLKMMVGNFVTRSCGVPYLVKQANATGAVLGGENNTCQDVGISIFCLCNTDECNAGKPVNGPTFFLAVMILVCSFIF